MAKYGEICSLYLAHLLLRSSGQMLCSTRSSSVHTVKGTDWIHLFIYFNDLPYSLNKQKEMRFIRPSITGLWYLGIVLAVSTLSSSCVWYWWSGDKSPARSRANGQFGKCLDFTCLLCSWLWLRVTLKVSLPSHVLFTYSWVQCQPLSSELPGCVRYFSTDCKRIMTLVQQCVEASLLILSL